MHGALVTRDLDQIVLHVGPDDYRSVLEALHADGYATCIDVTCVDQLTNGSRRVPRGVASARFEVVVNLLNMAERSRVRVRCQAGGDGAVLPTVTDLWPGADAAEREVYDMFGVRFEGHPDLTRILMPEDWEGHPLRKDYAVGGIPVQFKAAPGPR
jgi:NADH-quinone oxidoreductase subunit C